MSLTIGLLIALIVPIACAVLSVRTGVYYYNLGVTGSCILLLALCPQPLLYIPLMACLLVSIVGDYFMGHQQHSHSYYLYGILCFFVAHLCLIWFAWGKVSVEPWALALGFALAIGYGVYLAHRILPHVENTVMAAALCAYAAVSVLALTMVIATSGPVWSRVLLSLGVLSIVFSDTIISECDFAGEEKLARLIMPTYFACHILLTAGALVALL